MLTVHHLGVSQSERIVWLCEELNIPYELKFYARDAETRLAPADYKALHPIGTAPVITDGDLVLAESGAIIDYIIARHGEGRLALSPTDPSFADYLFWFHFANGSFTSSATIGIVLRAMSGGEDVPSNPLTDRIERAYAMVEDRLSKAVWFAGDDFSAADIMMVFPLTTMRYFLPRDLSGYPNILAYLQRVAARPAYARAMEKGDPGMELLLT